MEVKPIHLESISAESASRFWSRVDRKADNECWNWLGRTNQDGYGQFDYDNDVFQTHRFSWAIEYGSVSGDILVCHHCDNPRCVNPNHLFLGTQLDNMRDRNMKGRTARHEGTHNGRAILNYSDADRIRNLRNEGLPYKEIAMIFGVSIGCVNHIINGRHWVR